MIGDLWKREREDTALPRLVYELATSDDDIVGYFGPDGIGYHDIEEARNPVFPPRCPYFAVYGNESHDVRGLSGVFRADFEVLIQVFFHPTPHCNQSIVLGDSLSLGDLDVGLLSGDYGWLYTVVTPTGESYVREIPGPGGTILDIAYATLDTQSVPITIPVHGKIGARLWRTEANKSRFRFRKYFPGVGGDIFIDGAVGDQTSLDSGLHVEGAPIRFGARRISSWVREYLYRTEPLEQFGHDVVYKSTTFRGIADDFVLQSNTRRITLLGKFPTKFNLEREAIVSS